VVVVVVMMVMVYVRVHVCVFSSKWLADGLSREGSIATPRVPPT